MAPRGSPGAAPARYLIPAIARFTPFIRRALGAFLPLTSRQKSHAERYVAAVEPARPSSSNPTTKSSNLLTVIVLFPLSRKNNFMHDICRLYLPFVSLLTDCFLNFTRARLTCFLDLTAEKFERTIKPVGLKIKFLALSNALILHF